MAVPHGSLLTAHGYKRVVQTNVTLPSPTRNLTENRVPEYVDYRRGGLEGQRFRRE